MIFVGEISIAITREAHQLCRRRIVDANANDDRIGAGQYTYHGATSRPGTLYRFDLHQIGNRIG